MADRPLGINDIYGVPRQSPAWRLLHGDQEHWVWCRAHKQARKSTDRCLCTCPNGKYLADHQHCAGCPRRPDFDPVEGCIPIGPFMSEAEANRLTGCDSWDATGNEWTPGDPLGMEIER